MNNNQITVLLPGGFKPCTGAHLDLIQRYSEHPDVKEVKVLVGPGIRDGINQEKATVILNRLTSNMEKVTIEPVTWPSPVLTAYKIIGSSEPGYYALGASSKGDDYKRVKDFIDKHAAGSKYTREVEGVHVVELAIDTEPLLFIGRTDEYEGKPISASVLRDDIVNDDFDNFVTGYPHSDPENIEWVWKELAETVMNETQMSSFRGTTQSTTSGYDRSQPGYYYRSTFPMMEDDEVQDISEGGGAGHLASPWEHYELTFGEIKDIIDKSLSGKLENVTEKLDGQNIMVTFKEGNTYLARTQKQMKNAGQEAVRWNNVYNFFGEKTPDRIKIAYKLAISDIQKVLEKSKLDLDKIFKGGAKWLNIELLNPETENIVPYTEFQLRIHNIREVDINGKEISVILNGGDLDKITSEIIRVQQNENLDNIHFISKTNSVIFKTAETQEKNKITILTELDNLMSDVHLDDKNNIGDYLAEEIRVTLQKLITDIDLTEFLIQRWVWESKVQSITQLLKGKNDNTIKVVKKMDAEISDILGELLDPIITIFSKLGIAVLQNLNGIAASNPDVVTDKMKAKTEEAIKKINEFIKRIDVKDNADFQKKTKYLETQLRRLELGGGLTGIAPIEGIVFEYKGYLLKLTGVYLPILKIINFFQFGKDKLDVEPVNEFERGLDPKRALGIGSRVVKIRKCFRDLDIPDEKYIITPTEIIFNSDLYLVDKNVTWLPTGLQISGGLWLNNTRITELPEDLQVGNDLSLHDTAITKLPKNLKVGNTLNCYGMPIAVLPDGLNVGDNLYLNDTKVTKLPDDLEVGEIIYVNASQKKLITFIKYSKFANKLKIWE